MSVCAVMLVKDEGAVRRFEALTDPAGPDGPLGRCWLFLGAIDADGYGHFTEASYRTVRAYRFAWEVANGRALAEGETVDHLCRNRACVNPAHLEAVSNIENILRGEGAPARNARKESCDKGHALEGENLYERPDGRRVCRTCRRDYGRDYMRTRRAA